MVLLDTTIHASASNLAQKLIQCTNQFHPGLLIGQGTNHRPKPFREHRRKVENVQNHLLALDHELRRHIMRFTPAMPAQNEGGYETGTRAIKSPILQNDDIWNVVPPPARVHENIELRHALEIRKFVAKQSVPAVKRVKLIDQFIEFDILGTPA